MSEIEWIEGGTFGGDILYIDGVADGVKVSVTLNESCNYSYAHHVTDGHISMTGLFRAISGADAEQLRAALIQDIEQIATIVNAYRATEGV